MATGTGSSSASPALLLTLLLRRFSRWTTRSGLAASKVKRRVWSHSNKPYRTSCLCLSRSTRCTSGHGLVSGTVDVRLLAGMAQFTGARHPDIHDGWRGQQSASPLERGRGREEVVFGETKHPWRLPCFDLWPPEECRVRRRGQCPLHLRTHETGIVELLRLRI